MIQVNYHIPTILYNSNSYFKDFYDEDEAYGKEVNKMVDYCVDPIPRKLKKLLNNQLLSKSMYSSYSKAHLSNDEKKLQNMPLIDNLLLLIESVKEKNETFYRDMVLNKDRLTEFIQEKRISVEPESGELTEENNLAELLQSFDFDSKAKNKNTFVSILGFSKKVNTIKGTSEKTMYLYKGELYE